MAKKRAIPFKDYFLVNMHPTIRFLIVSDVIWQGGLGLLGPIFALFIVDYIEGGNAVVAGTAAAIYLITKSIVQIPAASIIDKICGEMDDFWILFIGSFIGALLPLAYLLVSTPGELYFVQFLFGAVIAFTFPSYMAIFTRHIDKNREGTDWGIYFTLTDLSMAATASIGGALALTIGYENLIILVVSISVIGILLIYPLKKHMIMDC